MTIDFFVLKGDLNGENPSGAFLFFVGYMIRIYFRTLSEMAYCKAGLAPVYSPSLDVFFQ